MKKKKLKNYLKLGILLFGISILFVRCQHENLTENPPLEQDNSLVFENLLETAKLKKEAYNLKARASSSQRGIDASFEATYGTPVFDKTIHLTNEESLPILIIPLKDSNDEVINLLIGYEYVDIEKFRILSKELGIGNYIYISSNNSGTNRCSETRLTTNTIGGLFETSKDLINDTTVPEGANYNLAFQDLPDGCYEWQPCDCPDGWGLVETDMSDCLPGDIDSSGGNNNNNTSDTDYNPPNDNNNDNNTDSNTNTGTGYTGTGGTNNTSDNEICGENPFKSSGCDELKLLSNPNYQNINPEIQFLKTKLLTDPENEWSVSFQKEPIDASDYFDHANYNYSSTQEEGIRSSSPITTGGYYYAGAHLHTNNGYGIFSFGDVRTLRNLFEDTISIYEPYVTSILVCENPDDPQNSLVYALKVGDINALTNAINNVLNNDDYSQFNNEEEKIDKILDDEGEKYDKNKYNLEGYFLDKYKDFGISLYKAEDDLSNWSKLELSNNISTDQDGTTLDVTSTPCD